MTQILHKLKRIISWIPVLWKTHVWGYDSLLVVMEHQLHLMETAFYNDGMCVDAKRLSKQFHTARLLINRINDSNYVAMAFDDVPTGPGFLDFRFDRRCMVPKQEIWEYESYMQKQDVSYLCKLMNKNLLCWWD